MASTITEAWEQYCAKLKLYPTSFADLNPGCSTKDLDTAEKSLSLQLPDALRELYLKNNGQTGKAKGIFKAVSGFDKYVRTRFLDLDTAVRIWKALSEDDDVDVFEAKMIPFAADRDEYCDDVFCMDATTGAVYLLWVGVIDPFMPAEWQTAKIARGTDLCDFLKKQLDLW